MINRRATILGGLAAMAGPIALAATPPDDMIGRTRTHIAAESDTLLDLARDHGLGFVEIAAANPGVDPWLPGAGTQIVLPTGHLLPAAPRRGIVINLSDQRLYFFPRGGPVQTYPIGVPAVGQDLRTGTTRVIAKRTNPVWIPPPSIRNEDPELPAIVPPGPDNPLGNFALDLEWTNIVIHGTNRPYGIGRRVSHGCFRLYPDDIEKLFGQVSMGTQVTIVDQPAKAGWADGMLYLEIHPTLDQADEIEARGTFTPAAVQDLDTLVRKAAGSQGDLIDWELVERLARERTGVAMPVLRQDATPPLPLPR